MSDQPIILQLEIPPEVVQQDVWDMEEQLSPTVVDDYCSAKPGLIREKEEVSLRHIKNEFRAVSP